MNGAGNDDINFGVWTSVKERAWILNLWFFEGIESM